MTSTTKSNDGLSNPFCYRESGLLPDVNVVPSADHGAMGRHKWNRISEVQSHRSSSCSNLYSTNRDNLHLASASQQAMSSKSVAGMFGAGSMTSPFGFGTSGTFRFGNTTQPVVDSSPQRSLDNTFQQVLGGNPHHVSTER